MFYCNLNSIKVWDADISLRLGSVLPTSMVSTDVLVDGSVGPSIQRMVGALHESSLLALNLPLLANVEEDQGINID